MMVFTKFLHDIKGIKIPLGTHSLYFLQLTYLGIFREILSAIPPNYSQSDFPLQSYCAYKQLWNMV